MTTNNFGKAYEAYQQAVYRDGKNPAFWCSIGVLYYNINQFHDALDAYSRAIRIHPYLAEVWFNLGALYEACNDQMTDAIDAYQRTLQLDSTNEAVQQRLRQIREHQTTGAPLSAPPPPKDISPSSMSWNYATNSGGAPTQLSQAGLGPDASPTLPGGATAAATGARNGTTTNPASPQTGHRFDGPPLSAAGSRPRSTDPYRRTSGNRHSPANSIDQSPRTVPPPTSANGHRLSAGGQPQHTLPQMKQHHDSRPPSAVRAGSPPSPRTRPPTEGGPHPSHPQPFPAHLAPQGHPISNGNGPSHGHHDGMDWERAARQASMPSSHRPSVSSRHPYSPSVASHPSVSHPHHQPHPSQMFERSSVHPGAHQQAPRPPFFDNPPPGPYGGYAPAGVSAHHHHHQQQQPQPSHAAAAAAAADEYARRRSSGSTTGSHRSSINTGGPVDQKPVEASAPTPVSTAKPRGKKREAADGETPAKKEPKGRKGKAAASGDGEASGATTPKKPRKTKATLEKEKAAAALEKDAAAKAAAVLNGARMASSPSQPAASSLAPPPPPALPQRDVDEDYDEGVDALMNLASSATPSAPPPIALPANPSPPPPAPATVPPPHPSTLAPPPPPPAATVIGGSVSPNPRKRSLPDEETSAPTQTAPETAAVAEGEPEAKRSRSKSPEPIEEKKTEEVEPVTKEVVEAEVKENVAPEAPLPSPAAAAPVEAETKVAPTPVEPEKEEKEEKQETKEADKEIATTEEKEEGEV